MDYTEYCLGKLYEKDEARTAPWKTHHAAKNSLLRANEPVITVVIKFPCASQIRCVNIVKKISLQHRALADPTQHPSSEER